jgi:hypothetical protein
MCKIKVEDAIFESNMLKKGKSKDFPLLYD